MRKLTVQMRVRLTPQVHRVVARAQQEAGLARFEDALGYMLDGMLGRAKLKDTDRLARFMRLGMRGK